MTGAALPLILRVVREGLLLVLVLSGPPLLAAALIGLVVGVLQSATQIHDQTVGFVPKLAVLALVLLATGPLLGAQLVRFTHAVLLAIPALR